TGRNFMNTAGSGVGDPSTSLRACRWMIAAPASAASIDDRAISSAVIGRYSDMRAGWIAPVTAELVMILAMALPLEGSCADCAAARPEGPEAFTPGQPVRGWEAVQ